MKRIFTLAVIFAALAVKSALAQNVGAPLTIKISGIQSNQGRVMIGVGDYINAPQNMKGNMIAADTSGVIWVVESLPIGEHKVHVFHDQNSNGKLDMNADGVPTEGVGKFEASWQPQVTVSDKPQTISIQMVYISQPK